MPARDYAGLFKVTEELLKQGIAEYGDFKAFGALSHALLSWPEDDVEGTLMVAAWYLAGERTLAYPPSPEDGVPPENTALLTRMVNAYGARLDDLTAAMGGCRFSSHAASRASPTCALPPVLTEVASRFSRRPGQFFSADTAPASVEGRWPAVSHRSGQLATGWPDR